MRKIIETKEQRLVSYLKRNKQALEDLAETFSPTAECEIFKDSFRSGLGNFRNTWLCEALSEALPELAINQQKEKSKLLFDDIKIAVAITKEQGKSASIVIKNNTDHYELENKNFDYLLVLKLQSEKNESSFSLLDFDTVSQLLINSSTLS